MKIMEKKNSRLIQINILTSWNFSLFLLLFFLQVFHGLSGPHAFDLRELYGHRLGVLIWRLEVVVYLVCRFAFLFRFLLSYEVIGLHLFDVLADIQLIPTKLSPDECFDLIESWLTPTKFFFRFVNIRIQVRFVYFFRWEVRWENPMLPHIPMRVLIPSFSFEVGSSILVFIIELLYFCLDFVAKWNGWPLLFAFRMVFFWWWLKSFFDNFQLSFFRSLLPLLFRILVFQICPFFKPY